MSNKPGLVFINFTCSILLDFEDPFAVDNVGSFQWVRYNIPGMCVSETLEFGIDRLFPSWPIDLLLGFSDGPRLKHFGVTSRGVHSVSKVFIIHFPHDSADRCLSLTTCLTTTSSLNRLHPTQ
jgi:hypothetical protein